MIKGNRIVGILLGIVGVGGVVFGGYQLTLNPYRGTIKREEVEVSAPLEQVYTKEEAVGELDFLMDKVDKHHPVAIDGMPTQLIEQYEKEISAFDQEVTTVEIWQASSRILHLLEDAHTSMRYEPAQFEVLPIDKAIREKEGLKGYEIQTMNNQSLEELQRRYMAQDSYEIEGWSKEKFERELGKRHTLEFIGIDTSHEVQVIYRKENNQVTKNYNIISWEKYQERAGKIDDKPYVYYTIDEEKQIGILTLTSCRDDDLYKETLNNFFKEVKEKHIKNVIVDLRENTGGTTDVITQFFRYLPIENYQLWDSVKARFGPFMIPFAVKVNNQMKDDQLFQDKLYILTSGFTFSSAMDFAAAVADNQLGEIIGEVPGNMPTCYGDNLYFQMPNTKLWFSVSYKYFERINQQKRDEPVIPHYLEEEEDALFRTLKVIESKNK